MAQLKKVVDPFGEVNVYRHGPGKVRVVATILMEPHKEGAQTGIALDGSGSMGEVYGDGRPSSNKVSPTAQKICAYLARKIDADGGTTCIYWATGRDGAQIEVIGDLRAEEAEKHLFGPPQEYGAATYLLPAVKYFVERFQDAPWGFYVFITDGELNDLEQVKVYSTWLAREVAGGRRKPLKFVLIGVGSGINEEQMEELDDLDTGTEVDLWDHKIAAEMRVLQEIFAEVVDKNARVADKGRILGPDGKVVKDYSDTGLPAFLEFEMPAGAAYFTLDVNGQQIRQDLPEAEAAPPPAPSRKRAPAGGAIPGPQGGQQPAGPQGCLSLLGLLFGFFLGSGRG